MNTPAETAGHAAARYKEIAATATSAVERMHEHERSQATQLEADVEAGREQISEAEQDQELVEEAVRLRWGAAMEALYHERWLRVTSQPDPDLSAAPQPASEAIRSVQAAYVDLHEALGANRRSVLSRLFSR